MSAIDLQAFRKTPLTWQPFPFTVVRNFIFPEVLEKICADFPAITRPGSFPASELSYGTAFAGLLDDIHQPEVTEAFSEMFQVDLSHRPIMITVRGMCREKDGQIHTDSRTKILTALLYMNSDWQDSGGRLRLLNSPDNLEDVILEVPPQAGLLLAFRNTENAWHGHKPVVGQRRTVQINWVTDAGVLRRELARHRLSARFKRLNPLHWFG